MESGLLPATAVLRNSMVAPNLSNVTVLKSFPDARQTLRRRFSSRDSAMYRCVRRHMVPRIMRTSSVFFGATKAPRARAIDAGSADRLG